MPEEQEFLITKLNSLIYLKRPDDDVLRITVQNILPAGETVCCPRCLRVAPV